MPNYDYDDHGSMSARNDMYELISHAIDTFMEDWGDYIGDEDQLKLFINDAVRRYLSDFEW